MEGVVTIPDVVVKYVAVGLFVAIVVLLAFGKIKGCAYENELRVLRNTVADKDRTVEEQAGVYRRLAAEQEQLQSLLSDKDTQLLALKDDLKKSGETLLTANSIALQWKKAYAGLANATQRPDDAGRIQVDFSKNFGYISVDGWTKTNPAEAFVKVQQERPLRVTLVVGQNSDGLWESHATSSEENVSLDIRLAAVNPRMLADKWYEKIGVNVDLGIGGVGFLGGVGVSYGFGNFELGPKVWLTAGSDVGILYGAGLTWHPWSKN
jgi:hypothetical protein